MTVLTKLIEEYQHMYGTRDSIIGQLNAELGLQNQKNSELEEKLVTKDEEIRNMIGLMQKAMEGTQSTSLSSSAPSSSIPPSLHSQEPIVSTRHRFSRTSGKDFSDFYREKLEDYVDNYSWSVILSNGQTSMPCNLTDKQDRKELADKSLADIARYVVDNTQGMVGERDRLNFIGMAEDSETKYQFNNDTYKSTQVFGRLVSYCKTEGDEIRIEIKMLR